MIIPFFFIDQKKIVPLESNTCRGNKDDPHKKYSLKPAHIFHSLFVILMKVKRRPEKQQRDSLWRSHSEERKMHP